MMTPQASAAGSSVYLVLMAGARQVTKKARKTTSAGLASSEG